MPVNANVFTGADGSLTLAAVTGTAEPKTTEGQRAQDVLTEYDLTSVGRVQGVRVEVRSEVRAFHELGQRYATELRPGNVTVRGTIARAYVNGALLKLLLGEAATGRPAGNWVQPALNISLVVANAANPNINSTLTLYDVKFDRWAYGLPEDDFVMEDVGFQALYLSVADEAAAPA